MKNLFNNKYISIVVLLIIGVGIGWFIKPSDDHINLSSHQYISKSSEIWTCSMHPQIRQNEPGQCPLCGMDLIPLSEDDGGGELSIKMSPTAMQLANVVTDKVQKSVPKKEIRLNGKVALDETEVFTLSSHIPGRIERLMVNYTGETVHQGQVLAYVYSPALITAQEELFEAFKIKDKQASLYEASIEKLKNWKLTEAQINQILHEGKVQELFPVLADQSGVVLEKKVKVGDYLKKGQTMYVTSNLEQLWVLLDVYEKDLQWVKKGDVVQFEVQSFPGEKLEGKVTFVDPMVNAKTRVAKARIEIQNRGIRFKPDMFVSGVLESPLNTNKEVLNIPKSAVMWTGKRSIVYVKDETTSFMAFQMRQVDLGSLIGEHYVVLSGLELGEEIAVHGTFSIDAAAQLAGKPSMMNLSESEGIKFELNTETKASIQKLLRSYLSIKNQLVNDSSEGLQKDVEAFEKTLSSIKMSWFEDEAHHHWMGVDKRLKSSLSRLKDDQEIAAFRKSFVNFSNTINDVVKAFGPFEQIYYIQRCPMANDDKGAEWLSKEKEVLNPYFGASMLRCGEVIKVVE